MESGALKLAVADGVATLTLDQPKKMNALNGALYRDLRAALAQAVADPAVRVVVLTGAGKAFSVGADLDVLKGSGTPGASLGEEIERLMREVCDPLIKEIRACPLPVVTALNGPAAGAAVGIALAADLVIAAKSAYLYLPFVPKLGILPDLGSTWFLSRLLTRARINGLVLLGGRLAAEQAAQWGVIWQCVEDTELPQALASLCAELGAIPPGMALEARRAADAAELHTLEKQLDYERERQRVLLDGDALKEGVRAFLEKRPPRFR